MNSAWYSVVGFGVLAWVSLAAGSRINGGALSGPINWVTGVLAVAFALMAGRAAMRTWVYDLVGWISGIHWAVALILMGAVLVALFFTVLVVTWDKWSGVSATIPIVAAWLVLPSLLGHGLPSGDFGSTVSHIVFTAADWLTARFGGWFR